MAILDATTTLALDQAVTGDAISENVMRLVDAGIPPLEDAPINRQFGAGVPLPVLIQVTETFATLTSLTITLETSANADLSSGTVLATSGAIAAADLVAGYAVPSMRYFPEGDLQDYVGMRFSVAGLDATAGKITAAIGSTRDAK